MKYFHVLLLGLVSCLLCCASRTTQPKCSDPVDVGLAPQLADSTVALVHKDQDGDWTAYCSGVWIARNMILTAHHCVDDEPTLQFITHADQVEIYETPIIRHDAKILREDIEHDLTLLITKYQETSTFAVLAPASPPIGTQVIIVGGPIGLTWTQMPGYVSAYRQSLHYMADHEGPFMQLAAGVWGGNSGCGVFDAQGHLVGIVNLRSSAPYVGFAIHLDTIRRLLKS